MKHYTLFFLPLLLTAFTPQPTPTAKGLSGFYAYHFPDTQAVDAQGLRMANMNERIFMLEFPNDSVYYENHENFQCFGNLPDYGGLYTLHNDTLTCKRQGLLLTGTGAEPHILRIESPSFHYAEQHFLVRGDTLICLQNPAIRLVKCADKTPGASQD